MKIRIFAVVGIIALLLLTVLVTGCASGGISQQNFDAVKDQLEEWQRQAGEFQADADALKNASETAEAALKKVEAALAAAEAELAKTGASPSLAGVNKAETVQNIVEFYHATHTYDKVDLFVCSDMASDVWNMLGAAGIKAYFMIGSIERAVADITQCDHAWVLAEVGPGQYLALETTGGRVYTKAEKPRYYTGWTFAAPKDYKEYQELRAEYNTRIGVINKFAEKMNATTAEYNTLVEEWNANHAGNPTSTAAQVLQARMTEIENKKALLTEMKREQGALAAEIQAQYEAIPTEAAY